LFIRTGSEPSSPRGESREFHLLRYDSIRFAHGVDSLYQSLEVGCDSSFAHLDLDATPNGEPKERYANEAQHAAADTEYPMPHPHIRRAGYRDASQDDSSGESCGLHVHAYPPGAAGS
jgi:hypothetical protein